ncbi:MAG: nitrogen regulation protein NR(I) [Candidatus Pelagisphaera sp.]|jgi:nitrogen regulation protein NR(I)
MKRSRVLIIDDDQSITDALGVILPDEGFEPEFASNGRDGLEQAKNEAIETVITDLRMPGLGGMELIQTLRHLRPKLPIIMITAHGSAETAIKAMQKGAFEYLLKPYEIPELLAVMNRAVESYRLAAGTVTLGNETTGDGEAIIGNSRAMQQVYKDIGRFAAKNVTVLIQGETGTGKELVARALYNYSDRSEQPFIAVNCAAIPENLLESELFGHEKGSFTGADQRRIGRFEQANGGTLFLDEIGDLRPRTQVKLLRALQEKTIQRIGGKETIHFDARIIAATHVDLETAITNETFREDLYYRLNGIVINIPPLRERKEDIPAIAEHLLSKYIKEYALNSTEIETEALAFLKDQDWPGNVRELENALRKALLEREGYAISVSSIQHAITKRKSSSNPQPDNSPPASTEDNFKSIASQAIEAARSGEATDALDWINDRMERAIYSLAIEQSGGNQAKAARWLGVSRITMREKLRKYGMHPSEE